MVNSLTNEGQHVCLGSVSGAALKTGSINGNGAFEGLIIAIAEIRLFTDASVTNKLATGFVEASGGGYAAKTGLLPSDWTAALIGENVSILLADQTWTATGTIENVKGVYLLDADTPTKNVIAWWERDAAITLREDDKIIADSLIIIMF